MNTSTRRPASLAGVVLLVLAAVATAVALHHSRVTFEREQIRPVAIGDCVVVLATPPDAAQAWPSSCGTDPSYTVGAVADSYGACPTSEYQHFPAADADTARLCLVPNLLAEHCYRLSMPIGMVAAADCTEPPTSGPDTGLLVRITARLDVHDEGACPAASGYAWPYPSPARTYCTATLS